MDEQRLIELQTMPYEEYLQTPEWMERRTEALLRAGNRCQICNSGEDLNAHHRTYERRGNEDPGDLTVLCQPCHAWFHRCMAPQVGLTHNFAGVKEVMEKLEKPENYLVPTGFRDIDSVTGQLQKGQFILVGSRSGQGALPLVLNIGLNAAHAQRSVAFFSLSMNKEHWARQVLSIQARLDSYRLQDQSRLEDTDWEKLVPATEALQGIPYRVSDTARTMQDIEQQVEQISIETGPVDLIIVDSIELLETGRKEYSDQRAYSLSRSLKLLARKFDVPVVAVSHISAIVTRRTGVPDLSDVKNAEAFADIVILPYLEQVYNPDTERKGVLDALIVKNSNGPVCEVSFYFQVSSSSILDIVELADSGEE